MCAPTKWHLGGESDMFRVNFIMYYEHCCGLILFKTSTLLKKKKIKFLKWFQITYLHPCIIDTSQKF